MTQVLTVFGVGYGVGLAFVVFLLLTGKRGGE
jgi:hypothetical protein